MNKRKKFCKIVAIFLIISIFISFFPNRNVIANSNSFNYILDEYNNAIITGCNQDSGTITIPGTIDGYDVVGIDEYAFERKNFTNVIISEGITSIDDFAFMNCSQLVSVELPNSLTKIYSHAFCNCTNLKDITLPESLESISYNVFLNCIKLEHINFPNGLKSIGASAFQESGIKEVEIPASMISISSRAFFLCKSLTSVKVYSSNVTYESQVYEECASNLKVYGYAGSTTQTYANENGLTFEELAGEPEAIPVKSIELDKHNIRFLFTGDSYAENVNATVNPENATDLTLNVTISNESIATISDITTTSSGINFKVTPISDGTAVIAITSASNNNVVAYCGISVKDTVYPSVSSISLNKSSLELSVDSNETLNATVNVDDERYKDVIWTSSNDSVARVDNTGKVTAISTGTATITATSVSDDTQKATCMVTVTSSSEDNILVESLTLNKNMLELNVDDTEMLTATVTPNNATNKELNWTSGNTSVAIVDNTGKVTAIGAGNTTIMASSTDGSGKTDICNVTVTERKILVTSVELNKTAIILTEGDTETLIATVTPNNTTNKELKWISSDTSVATVDNTGKVTAVGAGNATITVCSTDGSNKIDNCNITVITPEILVTSVELNKTAVTLTEGDTETLIATVTPNNATNKELKWTSSDTSVATVDNTGKVTAVGVGNATITVCSTDGSNKIDNCNITVITPEILVTSVELNKTAVTLTEGDTETLIATVTPNNATNKELKWTSSDTSVATVDNTGKVTAVGAGNTTIIVCSTDGNGKTNICNVTVTEREILVTSVELNKTAVTLTEGDTETLIATVTPNNATNKELKWTSSDTSVATVDSTGKVTAVGAGNATITVCSTDGSGKTDICNVTVTEREILVTSVELNKTAVTLTEGDTETLIPTVAPNNATNKELKWTSSDTSVATVDNTGKVTAVGAGNATITVCSTDGSNKIDNCNITVITPEILVTSVELNKTAVTLTEGDTETLIATVKPNNATNKELKWTSSDTSVATVDNTGKVTAVGAGNATITVCSTDGGNKIDSCNVTVTEKEVLATSIELNKAVVNLIKAKTETLTAILTPNNATNKELKWTSSDTSVATVDDTGKVIAVNEGNCIIEVSLKNNPNIKAQCQVIVLRYLKGDADYNGIINGTDASMVLDKYNKNNVKEEDLLVCDMDGNGIINGTDASMILDIYNKVL